MKHIAAVIVVTAVLLFTQTYTSARGAECKIPQTVDMKPCCRRTGRTVRIISSPHGRRVRQGTL